MSFHIMLKTTMGFFFLYDKLNNNLEVFDSRPNILFTSINQMTDCIQKFFKTTCNVNVTNHNFINIEPDTKKDGGIVNCIIFSKIAFDNEKDLYMAKNIENFTIILVKVLFVAIDIYLKNMDKKFEGIFKKYFPLNISLWTKEKTTTIIDYKKFIKYIISMEKEIIKYIDDDVANKIVSPK